MSKKSLFVSDVHLSSDQDPRWTVFLNFLKSINSIEVSHLYLLGDIFDLWIADHKYFISKYGVFVDELQRIQKQGVEIHYFEGNHDLYLKHYFKNKLGFVVHEGPDTFKVNELSVRVEHGDQMDPEDRGYLFLRWFLRTAFMKWFALSMPEGLIVKIGEKASESSRHYTSEIKTIDSDRAIDKIREHAIKVVNDDPFDLIVTGHMHVVDDYGFNAIARAARSINLGSWLSDGIILEIQADSSIHLKPVVI